MGNIVELRLNQRLPHHTWDVMVLGSHQPPARAVEFADHLCGRMHFARHRSANVATVVRRAGKWADAERIASV
jgi:hypothetical protein